jgi:NAD(P)-dependent dehydrogenase (short-subunit alcohol dehydrogenase family)
VELRLDGQTALVTGASKGIGRAIAALFAEAGASVMLTARTADTLREAAADMKGDVAWHPANAGDADAAEQAVAATIERFGGCDILVNNAATNPYFGPAIDVDLPRYDKTMSVNLRGPLVWTQQAWRQHMREHGGNVINISSIRGMAVGGSFGIYDNAKAALNHLTGHLATELGPAVRVNGIAPGLVKTERTRQVWEEGEAVAQSWPSRRLGESDDIAKGALFLASDAASWITGHVLVIDGGALLVGAGDW